MVEYSPSPPEVINELIEPIDTGIEGLYPRLFHYTSAHVAKIINKKRQLRFTCIQTLQLDDSFEVRDAIEIMMQSIPKSSDFGSSISKEDISEMIAEVARRSFVACFSLDDKSDYLWEYYATKKRTEDGGILLFDTSELMNAILDKNNRLLRHAQFAVGEVVYDRKEKTEIWHSFTDYALEFFLSATKEALSGEVYKRPEADSRISVWKYTESEDGEFQRFCRGWSPLLGLFTKREDYSKEREVRIVIVLDGEHYDVLVSEGLITFEDERSYITLSISESGIIHLGNKMSDYQ